MLPKFFRTYKNKQFNYIPMYYNPQKEELEERKRRIELEVKGESTKPYQPGIIRGSFRNVGHMRAKAEKASALRVLVIVVLLSVLVYYLFTI